MKKNLIRHYLITMTAAQILRAQVFPAWVKSADLFTARLLPCQQTASQGSQHAEIEEWNSPQAESQRYCQQPRLTRLHNAEAARL